MSKGTNDLVDDLVAKLKRRQLVGSSTVAQATLKLLIVVISKNNWSKPNDLLNLVKSVGQKLIEANPTELAVGNIVRRVLHVIREEYRDAESNPSGKDDPSHNEFQSAPLTTSSSMYNLLGESSGSASKATIHYPSNIRSNIIQEIRDIKDDLENIYDQIKNQASLHIHSK